MRLINKASLVFISSIFFFLISFLTSIIIAREMGAIAIGTIGYAMGILNILTIFLYLGFNSAHSKRVSEGQNLADCIGVYLPVQILLTIFYGLFTYFLINVYLNDIDSITLKIMNILLFSLIFESLIEVPRVTFTAKLELGKVEVIKNIRKLVYSSIAIYVAFYEESIEYLALASLSSSILGFLLFYYYFLSRFKINKPSYRLFRSYVKFALPLVIVMSLSVLVTNLDKIMVGFFFDEVEVGYYQLPLNIFLTISTLSVAVGTVIFPKISEYNSQNKIENIINLVYKSENYLALFAFPLVMVFIVLAKPIIIFLFTEDFQDSVPVFQCLSLVLLVTSINRPYTVLVTGMDRPYFLTYLSIIILVLSIVLNIFMIPKNFLGFPTLGLGALGAALSTTIIWLVQIPYYRFLAYKLTGYQPNYLILPILLSSILTSSAIYAIYNIINYKHEINILLCLIIAPFIYLSLILSTKVFNKEQLLEIIYATSPKSMKNYIIGDLKK